MSHLLLHFHLQPSPATNCRRQSINDSARISSSKLGPGYISPMIQLFSTENVFRQRPCPATAVICMANPRRVQMVGKQIRREIADMLLTDNVLKFVVLPEASLGADLYLSSLVTISDVEISRDLQVAKVYVSVCGDDRGRETAISGLKSKAKYVRSQLGKRMKLRLTPEVRFIEDDSIEKGSRVIAILDRIKDGKKITEIQNEEEEEDGLDEDIVMLNEVKL